MVTIGYIIKYLRIVLISLTVVPIAHAMTFSHAQKVYNRVAAANGITGIPLYFLKNPAINAYSYNNHLVVFQGMLTFVQNDDEIARVFGHELGHITLHHRGSSIKHEYEADQQGMYYMQRAGYSICRGAKALLRRNSGQSYDHPSDRNRYARTGCK